MKLKDAAEKYASRLRTSSARALNQLGAGRGSGATSPSAIKLQRRKSTRALEGAFGASMGEIMHAVRADRFLGSAVALHRLIIVFHAVHDLPEAILEQRHGSGEEEDNDGNDDDDADEREDALLASGAYGDEYMKTRQSAAALRQSRRRRKARGGPSYQYFLRYNVCGHVTELDLNMSQAVEAVVPVRALRLHHMFTRDMSSAGKSSNGRGPERTIDKFITSCDHVRVQLMRCLASEKHTSTRLQTPEHADGSSSPPHSPGAGGLQPRRGAEKLGEARLPLKQFKSDFVNKHDVFAPMGLELGMCSLRATVGLERTRGGVDASVLAADPGLREVHSVYVPSPGFHTTDPLPADWFAVLREPPFVSQQTTAALALDDGQRGERAIGGLFTSPLKNSAALLHASQQQQQADEEGKQQQLEQEQRRLSHGHRHHQKMREHTPRWCVTLQLHSLHNVEKAVLEGGGGGGGGGESDGEQIFCRYSFLGETGVSPSVGVGRAGASSPGSRPLAQVDHTENIYLKATWEQLSEYFAAHPTLQVDVFCRRQTVRHRQAAACRKAFKILLLGNSREHNPPDGEAGSEAVLLRSVLLGLGRDVRVVQALVGKNKTHGASDDQALGSLRTLVDGICAYDRIATRLDKEAAGEKYMLANAPPAPTQLLRPIAQDDFERVGVVSSRLRTFFDRALDAFSNSNSSHLVGGEDNTADQKRAADLQPDVVEYLQTTLHVSRLFLSFLPDEELEEADGRGGGDGGSHGDSKRAQYRLRRRREIVGASDLIRVLSEGGDVADPFCPTSPPKAGRKTRTEIVGAVQAAFPREEHTVSWPLFCEIGMEALLFRRRGGKKSGGSNSGSSRADRVAGSVLVGTAYVPLEDFVTTRNVDGTYDMLCFPHRGSKSARALSAYPPYLSASMYLVSVYQDS